MIQFVISPAKSLDFEKQAPTSTGSQPSFLHQSQAIMDVLRGQSVNELEKLMKISTPLATLNVQRHLNWKPTEDIEQSKQAVFAFNGDVYTGLNASTIDQDNYEYMQGHLRILSGLYGVLKPLDRIMPYRLEMGSKLPVEGNKNLYQFWGDTLAQSIASELGDKGILLNLASNEYFKVLKSKTFKNKVIHIHFKEFKNGDYKTIGFFAKKARGMMARYLIENQISDIDKVKDFNEDAYVFHDDLSDEINWVFTR